MRTGRQELKGKAMKDGFSETMELLVAARAGDQDALGVVAERYRTPLLERIRWMMGPDARSVAESSDFVQGLFVEIIRDFNKLQSCDERSFLRWATGVARNNIRDAVRRRREQAIDEFASSLDWRPHHAGELRSPLAAAAYCEEVERLVDALRELQADYQRVIELRHFESWSFAAIARAMSRTENAVQILHSRALIRLGEQLRRDDEEGRGRG